MGPLLKVLPALVSWVILISIVFQLDYPPSLTQATPLQLLGFFIPLFFAISFTLNLAFKNIIISTIITTGAIFLLILKALGALNIVTGAITAIAVFLIAGSIRKKKTSLTYKTKIPKLKNLRRKK